MTRRQVNRACIALMAATAVAWGVLMGLLLAGVDPDKTAVNSALYALMLLGGTTVVVSGIGDFLAPKKDPKETR